MKKTNNKITVVGYLYSHDLEEKVTGPNSKHPGTPFIRGKINIAVDEAGMNTVEVNYTYVAPTYSSGKTNRTYNDLKAILDHPEWTWISTGKDGCKRISVQAQAGLNEFVDNRDGSETKGDVVSVKRVDGSFINFIDILPDEDDRNVFEFDVLVNKATHIEANEELNYPERVELEAAVFDFRGALLPLNLQVYSEGGMNYFEDALNEGPLFTAIKGRINNVTQKIEVTQQSAFGEAFVTTRNRKVRNWEVTWASAEPYSYGDEGVLTEDEVQQKIQDRNIHLAEIKKRDEDYRKQQAEQKAIPAQATVVKNSGTFTF
jgi:hypothetical protein